MRDGWGDYLPSSRTPEFFLWRWAAINHLVVLQKGNRIRLSARDGTGIFEADNIWDCIKAYQNKTGRK
jgi:hypothetical protein